MLVAEAGDIADLLHHLLAVGVGEEEDHVKLVIGDAGADLLAAAVGVGEEAVDLQARGLRHHVAGGVGGEDAVPGQDAGVGGAELDHQVLLVVVGH